MFIILRIFFAQSRARDLLICQRQSCQSLIDFFVFSGTAFSTSKFMSSSETTAKTFPHLKFLKQDLHRISNSSFENWGISLELGNITRIFPSFGWGILCHVTRFDQSCASENI